VDEIDDLRRKVISAAAASQGLERELDEFEDAVRAREREDTLAAIRHSLHTLRGLVGFLKQEVAACVGPLEDLCDQLDRETAGVVDTPPRTRPPQ
jgi:chemotaxis protein histidine kinase CheA